MRRALLNLCLILVVLSFVLTTNSKSQTLRSQIQDIFDQTLNVRADSGCINCLPGIDPYYNYSSDHFLASNVESSQKVISTFSNLLALSASSFPLNSTASGLSFEFVNGKVVGSHTSAGPIFGETGKTLGQGTINVGMNITHFSLDVLRGINLSDLYFNFLHQDIGFPGLGDMNEEFEFVTLNLNLDVDFRVAAIYGSYGLTDKIDLSVAIPLVSVSITAKPEATMSVSSIASIEHFYSGSYETPVLTFTPSPISSSKTGLGDIALRTKYNLISTNKWSWSILGEARLPTGDEENFLGSGAASYKAMIAGSYEYNSFIPHINLAFDSRTSNVDRNEIELVIGYSQMISPKFTLAGEWFAEFEIGEKIAALQFDPPTPIVDLISGSIIANYEHTNLPSFENEHITNMSFGFKYLPQPNFLVLANVIIRTNSAGLRSTVAPTIGIQYSF